MLDGKQARALQIFPMIPGESKKGRSVGFPQITGLLRAVQGSRRPSADDILASTERFCLRISNSRHWVIASVRKVVGVLYVTPRGIKHERCTS